MSSDGERIPKPSKRRRLLLSDSESSDESIINTHSRRRVSRVVSDAESSDEDSDIPRPVSKRKNHRLLSENESSYGSSESDASGSNFIESDSSSDWQSDWESVDEDEECGATTACHKSAEKGKKSRKHSEQIQSASTSAVGFESDASDGQSEKCPICLLSFRNQEIATPSSCEHSFCLECIEEWSKNVNNCPVDRKNFTVIHVRSKLGGKIIRHVPVETKQTLEEIIQEDPTYCEICHECDREDRMLLCDGCDLGYHLECLNPPMVEVPMDEWFCPDCAQNSQNDAEAVDIDLDELPDLMEEARSLGLSYGRSRSGLPQNTASPRIIPRTRQTERVRANIRAGRDLNRSRVTRERETRETRRFDPDQPSTSSGIESIGENSRSRSPDVNAPSTSSGRTTTTRRVTTKRKSGRATTKRKSKKRTAKPRKSTILREVRITEINNDGEEEEIVTYVKVAATSTRRKKKYRRRKKRKSKRARTVSSVANASKTAKRRLAAALKINKPTRGVPLLVPTMKNVHPIPERSQLTNARYSAGISQVSLFGRNLGLDYSPPGSDDEFDSTVGHGPAIVARSRGPISTARRRMALKGIANPTPRIEQTSSANLLDSIISSQELWHSKKSSEVTLRANGTLVMANNDAENNHNINNNESPIKKKPDSDTRNQLPSNDHPLDLTNVNPNDITQAPMYNSSRGGGNRGNFRGGYRDNNRQSHGGQGYSGRDSYSGGGGGRRSFGGSGSRDRDFGQPANYSTNFEHRAPGVFGTPPLRNRNPQQFRNERNRYSLPERPHFREGIDRPPFPFPENFQRGPPPGIPPLIPPGPMGMPFMGPDIQPVNLEEFSGGMSGPQSLGNFESQGTYESQSSEPSMSKPDEECDIYGDMEGPNKHSEGESQNESMNNSSTLLPPPEPPSGLLDFDENSRSEKDNDSDQELVIDDAPKDDSARAGKNDDKYDPFNAEESDSNDSSPRKGNADKEPSPIDLPPLEPPPSLENFSGLNILNNDDDFQEPIKSTIRLTAYDDDDDEDSQADCPNFSIYSSETMDVARNSEQELSSQIGPLEPPPLPPDIPDMPEDDDVIVGDVQTCDLSDIPEPSTPYVEALQKERQAINNFPSKKISANDSRGKITFKINKFKLNSKFGSLYDEMDKEIENSIEQEKELEESREMVEQENIEAEKKNDSNDVSDIEDIPEPKKSKKRKRKKDKKKARRNSEDSDVDLGESTKDVEREGEQPELPMDELPTQKLQREDSQLEDFDNSQLPIKVLDISELQTQKLDSAIDPNEFDIAELATQKLDSLDSNAQNLDISDLPTQRLDIELDSSEPLTEKIDESELPIQKLDDLGLPTQKIDESELPEKKMDESELPIQKLDDSELPTQKIDESELDTQQMDSSELPTQKLDASVSQKNESDISELQTQRLYSPGAGVPTLYSPDVAIPTLYSPEPDKTEDDGVKTPDVVREWGSKKNEEEEATISVENEVATPGDEPEEGIGEKENLDPTTRADRSPETVISIADTTQSSQNDDCEIVEARADEDVDSNSYTGKDKRLKIQTGEDHSEIFTQERVDGEEDFPLEKEGHTSQREVPSQETWDSDGGYTPCKDELPLKERRKRTVSPFDESGLEPITPPKDKNDDLDRCRTPAAYAGLGTEAISETDEAMNFEDELTLLSLRKEKEMEEGEILEDGRLVRRAKSKDKDDESKKKKKKDKKDKTKESEKNKENISSENLVSWKKVSKSNKDRNYREKDRRSRSREKEKDKDKKKKKEALKKKEKRKELPRYDVRKIVAEKPRPRKDEYGRDIREMSRSLTRSKSRSRSVSKPRRSVSKARRSRSYSRVRSRTRSRSKRRSWSRDILRDRVSRGRTYSRGRSLSPRRRKSPRRRSLSKKRRSRSLSRRRRSISARRRKRSHSRKRRSRSRTRSRDRRKEKKKHKSRSRSRNRKRSRSKSAKRAASRSREKKHVKRKQVSRSRSMERSLSQERGERERNRNWEMAEKVISREQHFRERDDRESWSAQWTPSLSASRSKTPERNELPPRGWSPVHVIDNVTVPPKNLTVILTNKEAIKKKKKEKKKERRKSKEEEKRKKTKRNRTPPPSKEVFASGDNILVSVCFNKENESNQMQLPELPETIPLMPPTKRRRREPLQLEPPKKTKKDKAKEKRAKSPKAKKDKKKKSKAAEIAATKKPVAVIDLDQSPFREQTPSPRDVIVLSDDDEKLAQNLIAIEPRQSSQTTPPRDQFVSQGPKTPPEPQVKFSINNKTNLRPSMMNPLLEEEEEEEIDERVEEELEMRAQEELELRLKIGPNTPPEPPSSPPTSPDAYDPFDPTKSRSPTPVQSQEATPLSDERNQRSSPRKHDTADTPLTSNDNQQQEQQSSEKLTDKPKIISMVTLKRPSPKRDISPENDSLGDVAIVSESPTKSQQNQQNAQSTATPFPTINPVLATVAAAVQRNMFNANAPATAQRNLLQTNRISPPSYQIKQRPLERPQLPNLFANSIKTMPLRTSKPAAKSNALSQNGNETEMMNDVIDMSSPYSPGSTLSDGLFEPPSPYNSPPPVFSKSKGNKDSKKDAFDTLFGSSPATNRISTKVKVKKDKRKKRVYPLSSATNPKVGVRMDENQLQILDDLPSSAVEMQVKDKFLKKLNRQERVVEEVKLVLKPHYTKKHVTKEEYKDIMRKAVPKICHNRSGEINPKKIGALIEAYVKKCRSNKKKTTTSSKVMKPMKNLWS
ncbi:uncharacterized protein LOC117172115 isoform X3 [Belonocnema kinseyi]|uniref:uncharacterized protein LOC117172115 isoform X3 n=1 Tax=Belonocnema kinseyi TaxID=2817044 RepID=UPI00143DDEB6|nr:uncharacterized protein LOC117172115 isoform X3 [Belonocnema kinseyi]